MNVLLVDDHALLREGLAHLLQPLAPGLQVHQAGSAEDGLALLDTVAALDLVLLDIGLPGMSGLQAIGLFHQRRPGLTVVALSSNDDRDTVLAAIDAGAMGFIPKSVTAEVMRAALELVFRGEVYLPARTFVAAGRTPTAAVPLAVAPPAPPAGTDDDRHTTPADLALTPRQADVLRCILQGMVAKDIQRALDLAPSTVKTHTSAVLRALNVTTRTQAVVRCRELRLRLDPPGRPIS